jgi:glycopeptide antibiotics resistance protein
MDTTKLQQNMIAGIYRVQTDQMGETHKKKGKQNCFLIPVGALLKRLKQKRDKKNSLLLSSIHSFSSLW